MNRNINKTQGFTIIEVVLVLAIAALIFLMVFIALPALQASQRDTARKNDASIVSSAVTEYTSAYRRTVTTATDDVANLRDYVDNLDQYEKSGVEVTSDANADPSESEILVHTSSKCNGPDADSSGNDRQLAVRIQLENGTYHCVDAS